MLRVLDCSRQGLNTIRRIRLPSRATLPRGRLRHTLPNPQPAPIRGDNLARPLLIHHRQAVAGNNIGRADLERFPAMPWA